MISTAPRATDGYRFWVVAHSHWDREWPLPFRDTQLRLGSMLDEVLDVLERDPRFRSFTLDGQAAALEDFLELRPERAQRLRRAIAEERLLVGPSYVIPDEYLASAECLVRNLLVGRRTCEAFGGRPMSVGYLPDSFGHVAQLPQILRGFGLDAFVFWRGLGDEAERLGAVFVWAAPDGSEVLAVRQVGGYGNCAELGRWGRLGRWGDLSRPLHDQPERWSAAASAWMEGYMRLFGHEFEVSGNRDILLCNGYDHTSIQADLPDMLDSVAAEHAGASFRIASLPEFVTAVRRGLQTPARFSGELCGGRYASVFRSVNSTRGWLKRANEEAERSLITAETLASLAAMQAWGADDAVPGAAAVSHGDELRLAWRELLRNQSHDSISGSSVDEVELDMRQRFASTQRIARRVARASLARLAGREAPWTYAEEASADASVVNVLPFERRGIVTLVVPEALRGSAPLVAEADGKVIPVQSSVVDGVPCAVLDVTVPGMAARTVRLAEGHRAASGAPGRGSGGARIVDARTIENESCRVSVEPDGSLVVTDLRSGRAHHGQHRFEDAADKGDLYTFCPLPGEEPTPILPAQGAHRVRTVSRGPVVAELEVAFALRLPRALNADRRARSRSIVACPVRVVVGLAAGADRVCFRTTILNRARDHRLRVLFRAPDVGTEVRAEGHFGIIPRPPAPVWRGGGWRETPTGTHHTAGAVAAGGLTVLGRGLPEYEAVRRSGGGHDLALTLLRCVDAISRDDLEVRPGHVGPPYPTPGAQGLGEHVFEYAMDLRTAQRDDAALIRASQDFRYRFLQGPAGVDLGGIPELELDGLLFSALKPAEDGDGVILRVFAPAGPDIGLLRTTPGRLRIEPCRLDESALPPGPVPGDVSEPSVAVGRFRVAPGAVATFRLRPT